MFGYVYILISLANGRYYIGSTNNVERRIIEHNEGKSVYTKNNRPFKKIFEQKFDTLKEARKAESWIKKQKDKHIIDRIISEGIKKTFT